MVVFGIYQQLLVVTGSYYISSCRQLLVVIGSYQQFVVVIGIYQQLVVVTSSCWQLLVITGSYWQFSVVTNSWWQLLVITSSYCQLVVVAGSYWQLPSITDSSRLFSFALTISIDAVEVKVQKYKKALNVRFGAEKQLYFSASNHVSLVDFVSLNIRTLGVLNSFPVGSASVALNQCSHKAIALSRLHL